MKNVQRALRLLLVGLLIWPVLIRLAAFASPLWASLALKDPARSRELWQAVQPFAPLASFVFAAALVSLVKADRRPWIHFVSWLCVVPYCLSSVYGFVRGDESLRYFLSAANDFLGLAMLVLGIVIVLQFLTTSFSEAPRLA